MNTLLEPGESGRLLDVCGLDAPEPMVRILEALDRLGPEERLRVLIDREPVPLYRILLRNGYQYRSTVQDDQRHEVIIRLAPDA